MTTINSNSAIAKTSPVQFGKLSESNKEFVARKLLEKYPSVQLNSEEVPAPDVVQDFKALLVFCNDNQNWGQES